MKISKSIMKDPLLSLISDTFCAVKSTSCQLCFKYSEESIGGKLSGLAISHNYYFIYLLCILILINFKLFRTLAIFYQVQFFLETRKLKSSCIDFAHQKLMSVGLVYPIINQESGKRSHF